MSDELTVPLSVVIEACKKASEKFKPPQALEIVWTAFVEAYCENKAMERMLENGSKRQ